jgi:hypothetical protein
MLRFWPQRSSRLFCIIFSRELSVRFTVLGACMPIIVLSSVAFLSPILYRVDDSISGSGGDSRGAGLEENRLPILFTNIDPAAVSFCYSAITLARR